MSRDPDNYYEEEYLEEIGRQEEIAERLSERSEVRLRPGVVFVEPHEHADAPHALALLRSRRER